MEGALNSPLLGRPSSLKNNNNRTVKDTSPVRDPIQDSAPGRRELTCLLAPPEKTHVPSDEKSVHKTGAS